MTPLRDRGFTLIELLIVILIIGILAAVALPSLVAQTDKAKDSASRQILATSYKVAKAEWRGADQAYPDTVVLTRRLNASEAQWTYVPVTDPAVNALPADAPSSNVSVYVPTAGGDRVVLCSQARVQTVYCVAADERNGLTVAQQPALPLLLTDALAATSNVAYAVGTTEFAARQKVLSAAASARWPRSPEPEASAPTPTGPLPVNTAVPVVTGTTRNMHPGQVLGTTDGTWTDAGGGYRYEWLRCEAGGDPCSPIPGETAATYTLTDADISKQIRAQITATGPGGSVKSRSLPTDPIKVVV